MLNPFQKLELIQAEVFTSMPGRFRQKGRTTWSDPNRQNAEVECFLEGPAFDREGNLYLVDTAFQRIFRITPQGDWDEVVRYDGIEMAADNGLYVCHLNVGMWLFDAHMLPTHLIHSDDRVRHDHITNVALGGAGFKTAYMTDAMSGDVLMARVPVAGKKLFGLS
jgi:sugar lactone lactonase YvrE